MEYRLEVKYKNKKNISIYIRGEGKVEINVPFGVSKEEIDKVIENKKLWIEKKLMQVSREHTLKENHIFLFGEEVLCKEDVRLILQNKTLEVIKGNIDKYIKRINISPVDIKLKPLVGKLGSCTYDNKIVFSSYLAVFRKTAIEYVIAHELCHLIHKNHSKRYYELLGKIFPNYKEEEKYLKENGYYLKKSIKEKL